MSSLDVILINSLIPILSSYLSLTYGFFVLWWFDEKIDFSLKHVYTPCSWEWIGGSQLIRWRVWGRERTHKVCSGRKETERIMHTCLDHHEHWRDNPRTYRSGRRGLSLDSIWDANRWLGVGPALVSGKCDGDNEDGQKSRDLRCSFRSGEVWEMPKAAQERGLREPAPSGNVRHRHARHSLIYVKLL